MVGMKALQCDGCKKVAPEPSAIGWLEVDNPGPQNVYSYGVATLYGKTFCGPRCLRDVLIGMELGAYDD